MKEKFIATIEKYSMIEDGDNIVLGLSGGVDSMALLHLLLDFKSSCNFRLYLAHLNHGVRGEDARRDQKFVEKVAKDLGLEFYTRNVDMDAYAREHKITSEEAGRILRYEFFNDIIAGLGHGKIAVAHNLNDQAETLIMRFLRGTGLDGLRGIDFRNDNVIRPILAISRQELEEYIDSMSIEITQDMTNFQPIYTRNKIRLELLPYIEENFNPNIVKTLERTANLAEIDGNFLEKYSNNRYNEVVKIISEDKIVMDSELFNKEDLSIRLRIIRLAIEAINKNLQGISQGQVGLVSDIFESQETGRKVDISNNIIARVSYNNLIIEKNKGLSRISDFEYGLEDGLVIDEIGYRFSLKLIEREDFKAQGSRTRKYFDYDKVLGDLKVRNRRNGDRFIPFGMRGSKKIKDYFIDEKINRTLRDKLPIVVDDKNIIWVVGYRISNIYRVDSNTRRILEISYENQEESDGRLH